MTNIQEIAAAIDGGKAKTIAGLVTDAVNEGVDPGAILNEGMIDAMTALGERFSKGEIFVPEILIAARAMKKGVEALKPYLASGATGANGKVIIGTVAGDLHDIGKNLVAMMIESAGFEVIDLGVDVSAEQFAEAIQANPDVKIVALSALLTTTMPAMRNTIAALRALPGAQPKIIVGGAPVSQSFADEVGADGYSVDAAGAAALAKSLVA